MSKWSMITYHSIILLQLLTIRDLRKKIENEKRWSKYWCESWHREWEKNRGVMKEL